MFYCETCDLHGIEREAIVVVLIDNTNRFNPNGYEAVPLCEVHEHDRDTVNGYGRFDVEQAEAFLDAAVLPAPSAIPMGMVVAPTVEPRKRA